MLENPGGRPTWLWRNRLQTQVRQNADTEPSLPWSSHRPGVCPALLNAGSAAASCNHTRRRYAATFRSPTKTKQASGVTYGKAVLRETGNITPVTSGPLKTQRPHGWHAIIIASWPQGQERSPAFSYTSLNVKTRYHLKEERNCIFLTHNKSRLKEAETVTLTL